jgi:predicted nucleotidyltransferase
VIEDFPPSAPEPHREFLQTLVRTLPGDERIVGIAVGGSYLTHSLDEFSDLDLVIAVEPADLTSLATSPLRSAGWAGVPS